MVTLPPVLAKLFTQNVVKQATAPFKNKTLPQYVRNINNSPLILETNKESGFYKSLAFRPGLKHDTLSGFRPTKAKDINASAYVYCGSSTTMPNNTLGMSLDENGHLYLIKGKSCDFINGLLTKIFKGYVYNTAVLKNPQDDKTFENLYLDEEMRLVGKEKNTGNKFIITVSITENETLTQPQSLTVKYEQCNAVEQDEDNTYHCNKNGPVSFTEKEGKLYLKKAGNKDYTVMEEEIEIPLPYGHKLESLKKVAGMIQIETCKKGSRKIFYADPRHISLKSKKLKRMTHKPPQNLASRLGSNPYEKCYSGQPFSSINMGNFSSQNIPFVRTLVDNFRVNVKEAKRASAEGRKRAMFGHALNAIDPGIRGAVRSISGLKNTATSTGQTKDEIFKSHTQWLQKNTKLFQRSGKDGAQLPPVESFLKLISELKINDSLHLTKQSRIAGFFGIAMGGLPLTPGWFAGVIPEFSGISGIKITRLPENRLHVEYSMTRKFGGTGLVGTGQGLENALIKTPAITYMSIMPFEANLIISAQTGQTNAITYIIEEKNLHNFLNQIWDPDNSTTSAQAIKESAVATKNRLRELVLKTEVASEIRVQASQMVAPRTAMSAPRLAFGIKAGMDIINVKTTKTQTADAGADAFSAGNKTQKVTAFATQVLGYREQKFIFVPMHGSQGAPPVCYPAPVAEESKCLMKTGREAPVTLLDNTTDQKITPQLPEQYVLTGNIDNLKSMPVSLVLQKYGVKKGKSLRSSEKMNDEIGTLVHELSKLKKSLTPQQRNSQHKTCSIDVQAIYEPVPDTEMKENAGLTVMGPDSTQDTQPGSRTYRLRKLEFRRLAALNDITASLPTPLLNFSNSNGIAYDQYLGDITLDYTGDALSPSYMKRNVKFMY